MGGRLTGRSKPVRSCPGSRREGSTQITNCDRCRSPAGSDQGLPPAALAGRLAVAGEGMEDDHGVVAGGVQSAPGAIGHRDRRQMAAEFEIERADFDRLERAILGGVGQPLGRYDAQTGPVRTRAPPDAMRGAAAKVGEKEVPSLYSAHSRVSPRIRQCRPVLGTTLPETAKRSQS